ncbi:MAG: hypothetical protein M1819_004934 [Sarea resinae]|nr:MAG: hypothetical protein M1819_004934 [Sarea resinae]
MPFPFTLPTTSYLTFSSFLSSSTHPSLPLTATTHRGVLRDTLKRHKRLPGSAQASNLSTVLSALTDYLPYLFALDTGLSHGRISGEEIHVVLEREPTVEWRATLSASPLPGREPARVKLHSLEHELCFTLLTLAYTHTLLARTHLQTLYAPTTPTPEQRTSAITSATKHLLSAHSIHTYLVSRSTQRGGSSSSSSPPPTRPTPTPIPELSPQTQSALAELALADATLLAVLKDDPYPAAVAQARNKNDKEWMIKAPDIPKVRAHLFARLCLAAAEHAARAQGMLSRAAAAAAAAATTTSSSSPGSSSSLRIDPALPKYLDSLRRVARAKACRFLGTDADLASRTAEAIAWSQAALSELGLGPSPSASSPTTSSSSSSSSPSSRFSQLKNTYLSSREDRRLASANANPSSSSSPFLNKTAHPKPADQWGLDAGVHEESRVLSLLATSWSRTNDLINTQPVPAFGPLLARLPSGREIHSPLVYSPPALDAEAVVGLRAAVPEGEAGYAGEGDGGGEADSGDEEFEAGSGGGGVVPGAFPGEAHQGQATSYF